MSIHLLNCTTPKGVKLQKRVNKQQQSVRDTYCFKQNHIRSRKLAQYQVQSQAQQPSQKEVNQENSFYKKYLSKEGRQLSVDNDSRVQHKVWTNTPILSAPEAYDRYVRNQDQYAVNTYKAFYSSVIDGIVRHPGFMNISIEDHMTFQGDAVFEECIMIKGYIYMFEGYFDRFQKRCVLANIPFPYSVDRVKRVILETAAASKKRYGTIRFWLSSGIGKFETSRIDCASQLYVLVYQPEYIDYFKPLRMMTVDLPIPPDDYLHLSTTSRAFCSVSQAQAELRGYDKALFVDTQGDIVGGSDFNIGIVTNEGELVVNDYRYSPHSMTGTRMLQIAPRHVYTNTQILKMQHVKQVTQRLISYKELMLAREAFITNNYEMVRAIVMVDSNAIGRTQVTDLVVSSLIVLMNKDRADVEQDMNTPVPYGYLTGMREDMGPMLDAARIDREQQVRIRGSQAKRDLQAMGGLDQIDDYQQERQLDKIFERRNKLEENMLGKIFGREDIDNRDNHQEQTKKDSE